MKEENRENVLRLRSWLDGAKHAVFFGGAGVSTASGIPDFRGTDGLYPTSEEDVPPEYMLSRTCLLREPARFFAYYRKHMLYPDARPNAAHEALAAMEEAGRLAAVVTQNIDGLHERAGSRRVYLLHGTHGRCVCDACGKAFGNESLYGDDPVPTCDACGGVIRPAIVLYGEGLDDEVFEGAMREIESADLLIVGGSSLTVNPAAWLVSRFHGSHLAIINYSPTPYDAYADMILRESVAEVLPMLAEREERT